MPTVHELTRYLSALANYKRLQVLEWLRDPQKHFPPQKDGDLIEDGVCSLFIAEKLGISPSTTSRHMKQLADAGLVRARRIKQWTFYRRDEAAIEAVKQLLGRRL